ncbi:MAG: hypothetical protein SVR04_02760, partial [Spirochaetota bacterium]|nr:hypothetical protein [Spirochaetota bacterium]
GTSRSSAQGINMIAIEHSAGGITWRTEHEDLRFFTDKVLQSFHIHREILPRQKGIQNGYTIGVPDDSVV